MNLAIQLLKVYFQVNLILAVTFSIFVLIKNRFSISHLIYLRLAQYGVLLSLIIPLGLSLVPSDHFPEIELNPARMLPEPNTVDKIIKTESERRAIKETSVSQKNTNVSKSLTWLQSQKFKSILTSISSILLMTGFLFFSLRFLKNHKEVKRIIADSFSIRNLGRVSIRISEWSQVPFSAWVDGQAHVIIPSNLVHRTSDFKIAVRHELQHHRQGDTLWAIFIELLMCVFFVNPFIYFWKKELVEFQEFSCDEALIGRKGISSSEYGFCLVRVAESAMEGKAIHVGTTGMASNCNNPAYFKSFLRRRIEMFDAYGFQNGRSKGQRKVGLVLGTMTAFVTIAIAYGSERSFRQISTTKVNPGVAVFNPEIQAITERVLNSALEKSDAMAGFVLVSDPNTGKLLAAANQIREKDLSRPQKSWSLSFPMAAGSVTKPMIAAAAIEEGVIRIDQRHYCEKGNYLVGGKVYHDHSPFEYLTTAQTIAQSSDICSIKIGEKLGVAQLDTTLKKFGFGPAGTTQDFPEAAPGQYPSPSEVPQFEYIHMVSVGGAESEIPEPLRFYTTPLEILYAYGAIANGGKLMKPILSTASDSEAKVVRRVLSEENAKQIKGALSLTVTEGTGRNAQSENYSTAGKTSTGRFNLSADEKFKTLGMKNDFGGFAGFAPVEKPKIAVYAVIISTKKEAVYGGHHAAPVFRQVTDEVLQYLNVRPDKR